MPLWVAIFPDATNTEIWNDDGAIDKYQIAVGGSSVQGAVYNGTVRVKARLFADVKLHYELGTNPTADTDSPPLAAESWTFVDLKPGYRVATITRV